LQKAADFISVFEHIGVHRFADDIAQRGL